MITKKLAGCIITDKDNRVLLLHRSMPSHKEWEFPAGKVDHDRDETEEDAATREAWEELGVKVGNLVLLGTTMLTTGSGHYECFWFKGEITEGEPHVNEPDKFDDIGYFPLDRTDEMGIRTSSTVFDLSKAIKEGRIKL